MLLTLKSFICFILTFIIHIVLFQSLVGCLEEQFFVSIKAPFTAAYAIVIPTFLKSFGISGSKNIGLLAVGIVWLKKLETFPTDKLIDQAFYPFLTSLLPTNLVFQQPTSKPALK